MPLEIVRENIVNMQVDALVNSANHLAIIGGGSDQEIHKVAGPELLAARKEIGELEVGQAALTPAFNLPAKYVIHVVAPAWQDGKCEEQELLAECYRHALELAAEQGCQTLAVPLLGAGARKWEPAAALRVAQETISACLQELDEELTVYLAVFDRRAFRISEKLFQSVKSYVDEQYVKDKIDHEYWEDIRDKLRGGPSVELEGEKIRAGLQERARTFSEEVLRIIDSRGWKDADVYNRANVKRQVFSRLRMQKDYVPKKKTAISLAMALRLELQEAEELLALAGYSLSKAREDDLVVRYFLENGNYDVNVLTDVLEDLQV